MQPGRRLPTRCRPTCCAMKNDPFRLTDITSSHSSRGISSALRRSVTAALLMRVSTRPKALTTSAIARSMPDCERTSSSTGTPRAPAASIRPSVSDSFSTRREDTATSQPSRASPTAIAAPRPCDAPVTNATRFSVIASPLHFEFVASVRDAAEIAFPDNQISLARADHGILHLEFLRVVLHRVPSLVRVLDVGFLVQLEELQLVVGQLEQLSPALALHPEPAALTEQSRPVARHVGALGAGVGDDAFQPMPGRHQSFPRVPDRKSVV